MNEWLALGIALVVCFAAAALGSRATVPALREWYPSLQKPTWNPPNWVFGPVWTVLYVAMAVSVWIVWRSGADVGIAFGLFALQLGLNVAWSVVFFGGRNVTGGRSVIIALWLAVAATLLDFWSIDGISGALLAPYLAWVTFAALLNAAFAKLNSRSTAARER